jgi:hypothetical protein
MPESDDFDGVTIRLRHLRAALGSTVSHCAAHACRVAIARAALAHAEAAVGISAGDNRTSDPKHAAVGRSSKIGRRNLDHHCRGALASARASGSGVVAASPAHDSCRMQIIRDDNL